MKIAIRDLNLVTVSEEYVPLSAVIELENGKRIHISENDQGLEVNCDDSTEIALVAANAFIIKK